MATERKTNPKELHLLLAEAYTRAIRARDAYVASYTRNERPRRYIKLFPIIAARPGFDETKHAMRKPDSYFAKTKRAYERALDEYLDLYARIHGTEEARWRRAAFESDTILNKSVFWGQQILGRGFKAIWNNRIAFWTLAGGGVTLALTFGGALTIPFILAVTGFTSLGILLRFGAPLVMARGPSGLRGRVMRGEVAPERAAHILSEFKHVMRLVAYLTTLGVGIPFRQQIMEYIQDHLGLPRGYDVNDFLHNVYEQYTGEPTFVEPSGVAKKNIGAALENVFDTRDEAFAKGYKTDYPEYGPEPTGDRSAVTLLDAAAARLRAFMRGDVVLPYGLDNEELITKLTEALLFLKDMAMLEMRLDELLEDVRVNGSTPEKERAIQFLRETIEEARPRRVEVEKLIARFDTQTHTGSLIKARIDAETPGEQLNRLRTAAPAAPDTSGNNLEFIPSKHKGVFDDAYSGGQLGPATFVERVPILEGELTVGNLRDTITSLEAHIAWIDTLIAEYRRLIAPDPHNLVVKQFYAYRVALVEMLKKLRALEDDFGELATLRSEIGPTLTDQALRERIAATGLREFGSIYWYFRSVVAAQLLSIKPGQVWNDEVGRPVDLISLIFKKATALLELPPRMARAFYDFHMGMKEIFPPDSNMRLTEGYGLTTKHISEGHKHGFAVDWTFADGRYTPDTIAKVLWYTSQNFEDIMNIYETDTKAEVEPMREKVFKVLVEKYRMSPEDARALVNRCINHYETTTAKHFHMTDTTGAAPTITAEGPTPIRRERYADN